MIQTGNPHSYTEAWVRFLAWCGVIRSSPIYTPEIISLKIFWMMGTRQRCLDGMQKTRCNEGRDVIFIYFFFFKQQRVRMSREKLCELLLWLRNMMFNWTKNVWGSLWVKTEWHQRRPRIHGTKRRIALKRVGVQIYPCCLSTTEPTRSAKYGRGQVVRPLPLPPLPLPLPPLPLPPPPLQPDTDGGRVRVIVIVGVQERWW